MQELGNVKIIETTVSITKNYNLEIWVAPKSGIYSISLNYDGWNCNFQLQNSGSKIANFQTRSKVADKTKRFGCSLFACSTCKDEKKILFNMDIEIK